MEEVSWFQQNPSTSLEMIREVELPKTAKIIDVGGGDSFLIDHLLELGYGNLSVLDISGAAIQKAKQRLDQQASLVNWIEEDITLFKPTQQYDLWHDRAAFHFLTDDDSVRYYLDLLNNFLNQGAFVILGTFSEDGPQKCSGLKVKQYSEQSMSALLEPSFESMSSQIVAHQTPFNSVQEFIFCTFRKK